MVNELTERLLNYRLAGHGTDNEEYLIAENNLMLLQKSVAL